MSRPQTGSHRKPTPDPCRLGNPGFPFISTRASVHYFRGRLRPFVRMERLGTRAGTADGQTVRVGTESELGTVGVGRRELGPDDSARANRRWWDADAAGLSRRARALSGRGRLRLVPGRPARGRRRAAGETPAGRGCAGGRARARPCVRAGCRPAAPDRSRSTSRTGC